MVRKAAGDFCGRGWSLVGLDRTGRLPGGERGAHRGVAVRAVDPVLQHCEARNTSTRRGMIGTSWPVFGLRPTRWPFWRTAKVPNEEILTAPSVSSDRRSRPGSPRPARRIRCATGRPPGRPPRRAERGSPSSRHGAPPAVTAAREKPKAATTGCVNRSRSRLQSVLTSGPAPRPRRSPPPMPYHRRAGRAGCGRLGGRVVERQRDRGRRGVGVPVDRHHDLLRRQAELAADRVDDPLVGLVRHQPVDVGRAEAGARRARSARPPPGRRRRCGTPRGRPCADGRWCRSRTGRRRRRGCRGGGRRSRGRSRACRGRARVPGCSLGRAAPRRRRRRRTARRCRGPSSRGCARRSRRRSPARVAPDPARMSCRRSASA